MHYISVDIDVNILSCFHFETWDRHTHTHKDTHTKSQTKLITLHTPLSYRWCA